MANNHQLIPVGTDKNRKVVDAGQIREYLHTYQTHSEDSISTFAYNHQMDCQRYKGILALIPKFVPIVGEAKLMPLVNIIEKVAREFKLSEFELALFSVSLEKIDWKRLDFPIGSIIKTCGFAAKNALESDLRLMKRLKAICKAELKDFDQILSIVEETAEQDLKVVNKRYEILVKNSRKYCFNYNYYVDDILRISLQYQGGTKKRKVREPKKRNIKETKKNSEEEKDTTDKFGLKASDKQKPTKIQAMKVNDITVDDINCNSFNNVQKEEINLFEIDKQSVKSFPSPFYGSELSFDDFVDSYLAFN